MDGMIGEKDEEVYAGDGREQLVADDEINAAEEGFMEGYEGDGHATALHAAHRLQMNRL